MGGTWQRAGALTGGLGGGSGGLGSPARTGGAVRTGVPAVARVNLLGALDRGSWLTAVVAGPGAGKTTLLAGWTGGGRPVVRYAVRAEDGALPVFLRGLLGALDRAGICPPGACGGRRRCAFEVLREAGRAPVPLREAGRVDAGSGEAASADLADGLAGLLAAELAAPGPGEACVLVLDDVHLLPAGSPAVRFIEALCRHAPDGLRLVLASREELPFPVERLRAVGRLTEIGPARLAFAEDETYQVLAGALGDAADADELAPDLHLLTNGWPALVALGAQWLARQRPEQRRERLGQLGGAIGPLSGYLGSTLLAAAEPAVRDLVRAAAHLPVLDEPLCVALGLAGAQLHRHAPFLEPVPQEPGRYALAAALREVVLVEAPLPDDHRRRLLASAVSWYAGHAALGHAVTAARALGDPRVTATLLTEHGAALVAAGRGADVVELAHGLPAELRGPAVELAEGEARHLRGDLAGALACFRRLAGEGGPVEPGLAHRIGNIHHLAGDLAAAEAAYRRGRLTGDAEPDQAILLARLAGVHWLRGDTTAARDAAVRALEVAARSGDDVALANAHNAMAIVAQYQGDWDGHSRHIELALTAATRCGDLLAQLRSRITRSQRLLEESRFAAALVECDEALRLVDATGAGERRALVQVNRGWAYRGLGRLDEAIAEMEAARARWSEAGSALVAYALVGLGAVYLVRGDLAAAEGVLTRAQELAERTGDAQSWAALSTLARVRYATDPGSAWELTERSASTHTGLWRVWAVLTAGWLSLHDGDPAAADRYADEAARIVAVRRDAMAQAEERELRAAAASEPATRDELLEQARAAYARLGNPIFVTRTLVCRARLAGDVAAATAAEGRLRALGVRPEAARAAGPLRFAGAFGAAARSTDPVDGHPAGTGASANHLDAMRTLAAAAVAQGTPDAALRWYLRLLEHEPYDEAGHLGAVCALAQAGRHAEARRRYRAYTERMREIGAEPAPYPRWPGG